MQIEAYNDMSLVQVAGFERRIRLLYFDIIYDKFILFDVIIFYIFLLILIIILIKINK